jgi:hypothetical protein
VGSSPGGGGGSCSSEPKHDRTTAPSPKCLVSAGRFVLRHIFPSSETLIISYVKLRHGYLTFSQFVAEQYISEFYKFMMHLN